MSEMKARIRYNGSTLVTIHSPIILPEKGDRLNFPLPDSFNLHEVFFTVLERTFVYQGETVTVLIDVE